jgi:RNA recognition motif-containing protein
VQELKDFGRLAGGHVAYCNLDRDRKGCGFIEYLSREDAEEAIRKLNGQKLGGRAVGVSAHSRPPRRRSRSRSPIRRVPETPSKIREEPRSCVFPTSASRYSLRQSPGRLASPDGFTSPLYSDDRALPVVLHPDLYTFSKAVESYRTGLFHETTVAQGSALMLQTSSSFNSSESDQHPVTAPGLANNYYDFDAYLRLSYNHRLHACYS